MAEGLRKLLVVDDDDLILQSLRMTLPDLWSMRGFPTLKMVPPSERFDAAFVDLHLSRNTQVADGLKVIEELSKAHPHLEIVAISGDLDRNLMESCLKAGASRFLAKPLNAQEIHLTLAKIEALLLMQDATQRASVGQTAWIGDSEVSQKVRKEIASLRGESGPILIEGESGTGKEVVMRLIHQQEPNRPFLALNVSALPENLFESEFFGHTRGAFTGADQNKMGLAEAAHGGDLFLDEIEALPMTLQAKLLRFLESGEVRRVGGKDTIHVDVRVIVATNQNLEKLVSEGKFREDLLWRLGGKRIVLPPLRDRLNDIEQLALFFLKHEKHKRNKTLAADSIEVLKTYPWPGNVRELKRVLEQTVLISPLPIIRGEDFSAVLRPMAKGSTNFEQVDLRKGLNTIMADFERRILMQALSQVTDVDEAARLLDISRSSLYKKIKDYNIEPRS